MNAFNLKEITARELDIIIASLMKQPWEAVDGIIHKLQNQANDPIIQAHLLPPPPLTIPESLGAAPPPADLGTPPSA